MRKATRQPLGVIALLPLAWSLIGAMSAVIAIAPFRHLAPLLGYHLGNAAIVPIGTERSWRRAVAIGRAVTIAAEHAPFRSDCLPQAFTAALLCRLVRAPYAVQLGASLTTPEKIGELAAHAWVQCGPIRLTGGSGVLERHTLVACFVWPRRAAFSRSAAAAPSSSREYLP